MRNPTWTGASPVLVQLATRSGADKASNIVMSRNRDLGICERQRHYTSAPRMFALIFNRQGLHRWYLANCAIISFMSGAAPAGCCVDGWTGGAEAWDWPPSMAARAEYWEWPSWGWCCCAGEVKPGVWPGLDTWARRRARSALRPGAGCAFCGTLFCWDMAPSSCERVLGSSEEMMLEILGWAAGAAGNAFAGGWTYCGRGGLYP